jgi:hypothetical protein
MVSLQILLSIERRLTAIEYRLAGLEARKSPAFDLAAFLKGVWGKLLVIALLLVAQVSLKDAILLAFK